MWTQQIKSSIRHLLKHKGYSAILVLGLAIGLAASFLILLWVMDELSYDDFHEHADAIHIVLVDEHHPNQVQIFTETPGPLAETLASEFPEIIEAARVKYTQDFLVNFEDSYFMERKVLGVDPEFLNIFTFPLIRGDKQHALKDPNNILITQSVSKKYFGDSDPMGQTLHIDPGFEFVVTGVLKDLPSNSMFDFEILVPINTFMIRYSTALDNWDIPDISATYIRLAKGSDGTVVSQKIESLIQKNSDAENVLLRLFPLTQIHTHPQSAPVSSIFTTMNEIYLYLGIALLTLLIACINFMNLTTARFGQRLKEIGIKKVVGATRFQLIRQFMFEALLLTVLAFVVAVLLVEIMLPLLNQVSGKAFGTILIRNTELWAVLLGLTLLTGLIAGSYPAGFLSRFNPISILKKQIFVHQTHITVRKSLVVFQFTLSILFLFATLTVYQQLSFLKTCNTGYNRDHVISVPLHMHWAHREDGTFFETLKTELLKHPNVSGVTQAFNAPGDVQTSAGEANWEGKPEGQTALLNWLSVHYDFFETLDIPIVDGRSFSKEFGEDMSTWEGGSYIINESAARLMGEESPVGKWFEHYGKRGTIIGIAKDFHLRSLRQEVTPLAMFIHPFWNHAILIKTGPNNSQATIDHIRNTWNIHAHHYPFSYSFIEQELNDVYASERRSAILINSFAFFALFVACLGLLGLVSFSIQQKTKELGVRKILGSSARNIVGLLSSEYVKSIIVASLIAWPLSWWLLDRWLNTFVYHIQFKWWMFLLPSVVTMGIAGLAVSFFILRASRANPVEALRYE